MSVVRDSIFIVIKYKREVREVRYFIFIVVRIVREFVLIEVN